MTSENGFRQRQATDIAADADDPRVIDLTVFDQPVTGRSEAAWTLPYQPPAPPPPPARRRRLLTVAVAGCALIAAVSVAVGVVNYDRAMDWRDYARGLETREVRLEAEIDRARNVVTEAERALATAEQRVSAAERDATATKELLDVSESDIVALESRIATLANEKAQAEDQRWLAGADRNRLSGVGVRADVIGNDLDACVSTLRRWLEQRPATTVAPATWDAWSAEGDRLAESCSAAASGFEELRELLR